MTQGGWCCRCWQWRWLTYRGLWSLGYLLPGKFSLVKVVIVGVFKSSTEDGVDDVDDPIEAFEVFLAASCLGNWRAYSSHNVRARPTHSEQRARCSVQHKNTELLTLKRTTTVEYSTCLFTLHTTLHALHTNSIGHCSGGSAYYYYCTEG